MTTQIDPFFTRQTEYQELLDQLLSDLPFPDQNLNKDSDVQFKNLVITETLTATDIVTDLIQSVDGQFVIDLATRQIQLTDGGQPATMKYNAGQVRIEFRVNGAPTPDAAFINGGILVNDNIDWINPGSFKVGSASGGMMFC